MRFDSVCLKMNDQNHNQIIISAPEENSLKRKRGRPPNIRQSNECSEEEAQNVVNHDNLLGLTVSGVLNGTFDGGYFVTVKPQNSNLTLAGLVFCPEKVLPVTPENDLVPKVKVYPRVISSQNALEIQVPSTLASKCESREVASMVECDQETEGAFTIKGNELLEQGYEFQMGSYYTPVVENLQDYRIVDHDEIMKEFEASACMNAPASVSPPLKPCDYNLESMAEMDSVYPENLINNESLQNTQLKLMDATQTAASFGVNERPTTDDNVRSDLQLGIIAEAKYSTSTKMCHFSTEGLTVDKTDDSSDKQSEPLFFFNLNDVNKKSVTESLSFRVGKSGEPNCDSISDEPVQEGELKLIASGSNPRENLTK